MRARALLAAAACAATLLSGAVPADAHDESQAEAGALGVEARPAIAQVGNPVHIQAQYDTRAHGSDDDSDDDDLDVDDSLDDDESGDEEPDDDDLTAATAGGHRSSDEVCDELEAASDDDADDEADEVEDEDEDDCDEVSHVPGTVVAFTVDFGDGSEPEVMTVRGDSRHATVSKAQATHRYDAEGDYDVTVTATPATGDPEEATVVVSVGRGSARLEGDDRVGTALRISRDSIEDGAAGAVLLARSDGFADALASATFALAEEGPVLLVPTADLPEEVLVEIERVLGGSGRVYLLGGDSAISPAVADELTTLGYEVIRIAGDDRVATSVAITQFLVDSGATIDEVVLASAVTFPDALSGAAYAAERGAPVLLTAPDALSPAVRELLVALGTEVAVTVVGGTAGVSDAVVDELVGLGFTVERLAGDDRYDTAVEIAEAGHEHPTVVVIATGRTFPDALAGGAYAGRLGAPLLLVGEDLPAEVAEYLTAHADTIKVLVVLGGGGAVPQPVMDDIEAALGL